MLWAIWWSHFHCHDCCSCTTGELNTLQSCMKTHTWDYNKSDLLSPLFLRRFSFDFVHSFSCLPLFLGLLLISISSPFSSIAHWVIQTNYNATFQEMFVITPAHRKPNSVVMQMRVNSILLSDWLIFGEWLWCHCHGCSPFWNRSKMDVAPFGTELIFECHF